MPSSSPDARHRMYFASYAVLTLLATAFMAARCVAKRMKRLKWTWDDIFLMGALLLFYVCVAGSIISAVTDVGIQRFSATSTQVKATLILLWALQLPHAAALALIRCSITILFMRIFYTPMFPKLRFAAYASAASSVSIFVVALIVNMTHCRPIFHNWHLPLENPKYCYPLKPCMIVVTAWGLVNDVLIWSLPHFVVWSLRLRLAHKIAISAIFALACLNILMAIFRIISLLAVTFSGDLTYDVLPTMVWAVAQLSTAIIVACCPLLRPVFEKLLPTGLTRALPMPSTKQARPSSIRVTTRIDVLNHTSRPRSRTCFPKGLQESEGPIFEVARQSSGQPWCRV